MSDEGSLVEVESGLQLMTNSKNERVGDHVVVAFRPEFASIEDSDINRISGNVLDIIYSGSIGRLKVKLSNGNLVVFKMALNFKMPVFHIGDNITLTIPPKNILVYPYPKEGLDNELALE